ncbi:MAG: response regulator transcription factor [Deltaproteobacteria bacterium]|nr:response regulator transcription factor [Deltaproteobacteria bacterium]
MTKTTPKVLVIDDSEVFRQVLRTGIVTQFPSARVTEAADWGPALKAVRNCVPDIAIVDISLPRGSGFHLAAKLAELAPGLTIVFCSLHDLPEYRQKAADRGARFWAKATLSASDFASLAEGRQEGS